MNSTQPPEPWARRDLSMNTNQEFQPNWASAPGDTIADILRERGISVESFAESMHLSLDETNNLLQGRVLIKTRVARSLSRVLGASSGFWMHRERQYRRDLRRLAS